MSNGYVVPRALVALHGGSPSLVALTGIFNTHDLYLAPEP